MTGVDYLKRRFAYEDWARERILRAMAGAEKPLAEATHLMAHTLRMDAVWRQRLEGHARTGESLWPEWSLEDCRDHRTGDHRAWMEFLDALTPSGLEARWEGAQEEDLPFLPRVSDVLEHVLDHAAQHRGQIASAMRQEGVAPVNTDFLHYADEMEA